VRRTLVRTNRRLVISSLSGLAIVGVALYFSIDRGTSRSKAVRACLARHGVQLHHQSQQLAIVPPSDEVAELTGTIGGHRIEVMFFKGGHQERFASITIRVDLDDWKAENGAHTRSEIAVVQDALVGWSGPPTARNRQLVASCLRG
jgi:hypothetical protein